MEIIIPHWAGGGVHTTVIVVCRRWLDEHGKLQAETRRFSTMPQDLDRLRDWLLASGCTASALESTAVSWQPVSNILEGDIKVWLVTAQPAKQLPGRKTDLKDA